MELSEYFKQKLGATQIKVCIENGCKHGTNFIGIVYRVAGVRIPPDDNGQNEENIFLKIAPDNRVRRERFRVRASFLREIFVYKEVKKKIVHKNLNQNRSEIFNCFMSPGITTFS